MTTALTTRVSTDSTYAPTVKGSPLSSAEIDNNFISLATNKIETSVMATAATANKLVLRDGSGNINVVQLNATSISGLTTPLSTGQGGTGQTTYTSGQLLIGNSSGTLTAATLTGTTNRVTVTNSSGGITLSTPQDISTASNVQFDSLGVGVAGSATSGEIRATNQITAYYSDERLKENITLIPNALDKVLQLRGVTYNANQLAESFGFINKEKQVGVIASDVEKVLPEAVKPAPFDILRLQEGIEISKSGENYKTVQYEKIVPLLIEAIKELSQQVQELKGNR
jgi:hypothetical protein